MKKMLLFFIAALTSMTMMADVATLELGSSNKFGTSSGSTRSDDAGNVWTVTTNSGAIQNQYSTGYHGQQFGTSKAAWTGTFTNIDVEGTITSVKIDANTGGSATVAVTVGSTTFQYNSANSASIEKNTNANAATWYDFTGSASGTITITVSGTSAAFYLGGVQVTYSTGGGAEGKTLYLNTGGSGLWNQSGAKFAVWYWGTDLAGTFSDYMTPAQNETDIFTVQVPENAEQAVFVRMSDNAPATPAWGTENANVWNQTGDLNIPTDDKDMYTITNWDGCEGKSCGSWSKYVYVEPCTPNFGVLVNDEPVSGTWKESTGEWAVEGLALEEGDIVKLYNKCEETVFEAKDGNYNNYFDQDHEILEVDASAVYDLYITLVPGNDKLWVTQHPYKTYVKVTEELPFWTGDYIISWDDTKPHTVIDNNSLVAAEGAPTFTPGDEIQVLEEYAVHIGWNAEASAYVVQLPNTKYLKMTSGSVNISQSEVPVDINISWLVKNASDKGVALQVGDRILQKNGTNYRAYAKNDSYPLPTLYRLEDQDYDCANGHFALEVNETETINMVDAPDQALEEQGYRQFKVTGVALTAGQTIKIRNLTCESRFIADIEEYGKFDCFETDESEEVIKVLTDGKYDFYFKNKYGADRLYITEYSPEITYADSVYCVAGNFTNWKKDIQTLPADVDFPKDSTLEFKQLLVRAILADGVPTGNNDTIWFGQANEGSYMERGNSAWTLNGEHNVLLKTDIEGSYGFKMDEHGHFVVTFPVVTYDSTYYVAGTFTNWKEDMQAIPYTLPLEAGDKIEFKQVIVRNIYSDDIPVDADSLWFGQVIAGSEMTRENNVWTLNGTENVVLTADIAGNYTFSRVGNSFMVEFPALPVITYRDTIYNVAGDFTSWQLETLPFEANLSAGSVVAFRQVLLRSMYSDGVYVRLDTIKPWSGAADAENMMTRESSAWLLNGDNNVRLTTDIAGTYRFDIVDGIFTVTYPALPVITYDTTAYVAGNFTNWANGMTLLPANVNFPKDSTIIFKQVRVITTYEGENENMVEVKRDTTWYGQANNDEMTRKNNAWTLYGSNNVRFTADVAGDYTFRLVDGIFVVDFPELIITNETISVVAGTFGENEWVVDINNKLPLQLNLTAEQTFLFKQVDIVQTYHNGVLVSSSEEWRGQVADGTMNRNDNCWLLDGNNNVFLDVDATGVYTFSLKENGELLVTYPALAPTGIDNNEIENENQKIIENGQLIIIRDGVRYNALGQVVE